MNNWNSGQFIIDIGIAAGLTIVAAEAAPAALAFGSAVVDFLAAKGSQTAAAFTNVFNNGNALVTNIGVVMNSGAVEISSAEALLNLQVAAGQLSLAANNILAASGQNPSLYANIGNGGASTSGSSGSAQGNIPNKDGRKGGQAHQDTIKEIRKTYEENGFDVEYHVKTPSGYKNSRFGDLIVKDPNTGEEWIVQVGKQTQAGNPVSREVKAIIDLMKVGYYVEFVPYN